MPLNEEKLIIAFDAKQKEVLNALDKVGARLAGLEKKAETAGKKTGQFGKMLARGLGSAIKMAAKLTAALGVGGLAGVLYKTIRVTEDFEKKLSEVGTLLGDQADKKIPKYEKAIRNLALRSNASVSELTGGLYQVISAGTEGTESVAGAMKLLETSQKAAVAGVADTFSTVDVLTTALNAYGRSADDATKFSDMLFTTVKMGKVNLSQLSNSLGMVVSNASGAGVSFEEVNAAMAATTKAGVPVQRAVTSINAAIRILSKGTKELDKALGESASDLLRREGFVGAMERLREVTNGDTIAMQQLGIEQEAIAGLSVLAGTGIDNFREALDAMRDSTGATDKAFERMSKTFEFQKKQFWNKLNDMLLDLGSEIMPMLVSAMTDFGTWVSENKNSIIDFLKGVLSLIRGILHLVKVLFGWVVKLVRGLRAGADQMQRMLTGLVENLTGRVAGRTNLGKAMDESLSKWQKSIKEWTFEPLDLSGEVETGKPGKPGKTGTGGARKYNIDFGTLVGGGLPGAGMVNFSEAIRRAVGDAVESAGIVVAEQEKRRKEAAQGRAGALAYGERLGAEAKESYLDMRAAWSEKMAQKFGEEAGESWLDTVKTGFLEAMGERVEQAAWKVGEIVATPFKQVYQLLVEVFSGNINKIKSLVNQFVGLWERLAENLDKILEYIVSEGVPRIMKAFISSLPAIFDAIAKWLPVLIEQLIGYLPAIIAAIIKGVAKIVGAIIAHLPQIIGAIISAIMQIVFEIIKLLPKVVFEIVKGIVKAIFNLIGGLFGKKKGKKGDKSKMPTVEQGVLHTKLIEDDAEREDPTHAAARREAAPSGYMGLYRDPVTGKVLVGSRAYEEREKDLLRGTSIGSFHAGGFVAAAGKFARGVVNFSDAVRAHGGMYVGNLGAGEVPAVLQAGEGVLNRAVTSALGGRSGIDRINRGEGVGGDHYHVHVDHVFADDIAKVFDSIMAGNLRRGSGAVYRSLRAGVPGFSAMRSRGR